MSKSEQEPPTGAGLNFHIDPASSKEEDYLRGTFATLLKPGKVLLVDDNPDALDQLVTWIERSQKGRWHVIKAFDPTEALRQLKQYSSPSEFPDVISIDLGLSLKPDDPWYGLALLRLIRGRYSWLNLAVHSALSVEGEVLSTILSLKASYIRLHQDPESQIAFARMLPFLARGYLVYSAHPAEHFPSSVHTKPDPLPSEDWDLLRDLAFRFPDTALPAKRSSKSRTINEIALLRDRSPRSISDQIEHIARDLIKKGFIEPKPENSPITASNQYRPKLEDFYIKYAKMYGRLDIESNKLPDLDFGGEAEGFTLRG